MSTEGQEQEYGFPFGIVSAINRLLARAKHDGVPLTLLPAPSNQGGGWSASLGDKLTRVYDDATDAVFALDKLTS